MSDNYRTDKWILSMFGDWFDPCPFNPEWPSDDLPDGLSMKWRLNTFVNPPYSNPLPWVKKAILENKIRGCTIVLLLKHDSSTEWYRLLHEAGAHMLMVNKRLKHQTNRGCSFPSALFVLAGRVVE